MGIFRQDCWSPELRVKVKKVVGQCRACVIAFKPLLMQPPLPLLPKERANLSRPFKYVRVDHMGPIQTTEGAGHIQLIDCMTTRVVYLEFCGNLEAVTFILGLRRFSLTHGTLSLIVSDNHQIFLQELYEEDHIQEFLRRTGIQWHFQTPQVPWKGGFFKRLVGVVKRSLKVAFQKKSFPEQHVRTLVKEAKAMVNNRPLMYIGDGREDQVLTPSHMLQGCLINLMVPLLPPEDLN
ncbi:uncharacterized protein LOC135210374 [Macrobrachium nipponense]|uniref:uncharacterized protein LOC135210374 n=1 Tax=Macrobrachium nipponense TaxID=159736 RepID=UPI0030C87EB8